MKKILLIIVLFVVSGCEIKPAKIDTKARAEKRNDLFVDCMKMAAAITRAGDDDVADIISECDSRAYYTSNAMF